MLNALKIIRGAVSDKNLVPVLTHVAVHAGRLHGFDGRVHISVPAPKELKHFSFTVPMMPFMAAIEAGKVGCMVAHNYETNRLVVTSNNGFLASMPTGDMSAFPLPTIEGKKLKVQGLLPVLQALHPFIGQDATRPWSAGILFQGAIAMATNNAVLVEAPVQTLMPKVVIPVFAVEEILALGMEPQSITLSEHAMVLHYPGSVWLRTVLLEDTWPDAKAILKAAHLDAHYSTLPEGLLTAVQQIQHFCPDTRFPVIRCQGNTISTQDGATSASVGGLKGQGVGTGAFHAEPLCLALSVAQTADWSRFPRVPFAGSSHDVPLDGVLLGIVL